MTFPAGLTLVTVAIRFDLPPDGGAAGKVVFTRPRPLTGAADGSIVPPKPQTATLDDDGTATIQLPATNDPQWVPTGWAYAVHAQVGGTWQRGTLQLDYQTTSVQFADLIQWSGAAETGTTYATLAQLNTVDDRIDDLGVDDIDDLQTQLDGKQNAGTYLTPADITNLVSYQTMTESLVLKADLALVTARTTAASDHGLAGWTFDPVGVQAGLLLPTAGLMHTAKIRVLSTPITNILFHFTVAGSSLTAGQCFAALYTEAGALVATTVDQATNWQTGGLRTCALTTPQAVTPYSWYRVAWWYNGTTAPTISRAVNSSSAIVNVGLAAPSFRYATADTGRTTSAPSTLGTQTGGATAWWVGVS